MWVDKKVDPRPLCWTSELLWEELYFFLFPENGVNPRISHRQNIGAIQICGVIGEFIALLSLNFVLRRRFCQEDQK